MTRQLVVISLFTMLGCGSLVPPPPMMTGGEVVPAGEEPDPNDLTVLGRYWVELEPIGAKMKMYRLYPGNIIFRNEHFEDVTYNYSNTVTLSMSTPQAQATYRDINDNNCWAGGVMHTPCPDSSWPSNCQNRGVFCGPIVAVNNTGNLLPDVIVAITGQGSSNPIRSCGNIDGGRCGANGDKLINFNTNSPASIDTCAYCYGNTTKASNACAPGLRDGMRSGDTSGTLLDVNTNEFGLSMTNDMNSTVTFTVRRAAPQAQSFTYCRNRAGGCGNPPACLTPGSNSLRIDGSGFGLTGECTGTAGSCPSTWCPITGTTMPPSSTVTFTGTATAPVLNTWADQRVFVQIPTGATDGPVTITTPMGSTSVTVNICP